ncbi:NUDIX domain-containing protein [Paenibacillus sp. NPDC056579]|uniref:NUDIX domain-containing protein n=1 Tax=Paenibacillus sp. NPDC056579 TaxID=3345871 RepID=UPI0036911949
MSLRPSVCAAIIIKNRILMVFQDHGDRSFWTLPGGGVENGESLEEAVLREVREEVKLNGRVERLLFEATYANGPDYCFLVTVDHYEDAQLGEDPELLPNEQVLKDISWFTLEEKKNDIQISEVIKSLNYTN